MWLRLLHLLFMALLVVGNVDLAGVWCAAESDRDSPLPAEPAEEECESTSKIELDKFHSGAASLPPKTTARSQQQKWTGHSVGDAQLAECSDGAIGVRGPPLV